MTVINSGSQNQFKSIISINNINVGNVVRIHYCGRFFLNDMTAVSGSETFGVKGLLREVWRLFDMFFLKRPVKQCGFSFPRSERSSPTTPVSCW